MLVVAGVAADLFHGNNAAELFERREAFVDLAQRVSDERGEAELDALSRISLSSAPPPIICRVPRFTSQNSYRPTRPRSPLP